MDIKDIPLSTPLETGYFLAASGFGGILDSIWDVAPFVSPFELAPMCGAFVIGVRRIWIASKEQPPKETPKTGAPDL